jgi:hypothetical protein
MNVVVNTITKWPQGAKRAKQVDRTNKLNENTMWVQVCETYDMAMQL